MLLSTSSSKDTRAPGYMRAILATVALLVLMGAALEVTARLGFGRISHIASRISTEYGRARTMRRGTPARPSFLLVGNSLLLYGVDYDAIRRAVPAEITRFAFEDTSYFDWYYGLKRLFTEGARPDHVALMINIPQLVDNSIVGEYGAFYLFRPPDTLRAGHDAGYDLTKTSGLLFGDFSLYYAARNEIRNYLLNRAYPSYAAAIHNLVTVPAGPLADEVIVRRAAQRLGTLDELCRRYGAHFEFILPPGFGTGDAALAEAGRRSHTTVLVPVRLGAWGEDRFRDGFHLNPEGAAQFTRALVPALERILPMTRTAGLRKDNSPRREAAGRAAHINLQNPKSVAKGH